MPPIFPLKNKEPLYLTIDSFRSDKLRVTPNNHLWMLFLSGDAVYLPWSVNRRHQFIRGTDDAARLLLPHFYTDIMLTGGVNCG